mgnify:CR=1 FL=1
MQSKILKEKEINNIIKEAKITDFSWEIYDPKKHISENDFFSGDIKDSKAPLKTLNFGVVAANCVIGMKFVRLQPQPH